MRTFVWIILALVVAAPAFAQTGEVVLATTAEARLAEGRARLAFLAVAADKFEAQFARPPRHLSELRLFAGPRADFRDPWGHALHLDPEAGTLRSDGPDGLHAGTKDTTWADDLSVDWRECAAGAETLAARRTLEALRAAIFDYWKNETKELATLDGLAGRYLTGAVELRDPWGEPYRLDPKELTLLSTGPDRQRTPERFDDTWHDDLVLSLDTASAELRSLAALALARRLAATVEVVFDATGSLPASLAGILNGSLTDEAGLRDPWDRPFAYDTLASLIRSPGADGVSDPARPATLADDIRAGFLATSPRRDRERASAEVALLARAAFRFHCREGRAPDRVDLLKARGDLPEEFPAADPWGGAYALDPAGGLAIAPGPDGVAGSGDDLRADCADTDAASRLALARELVDDLAVQATRYERKNKRPPGRLLDLSLREVLTIAALRDPWGQPPFYDPAARVVGSAGPDGRHAETPDATWGDDLTAECGLKSPAAERLKALDKAEADAAKGKRKRREAPEVAGERAKPEKPAKPDKPAKPEKRKKKSR